MHPRHLVICLAALALLISAVPGLAQEDEEPAAAKANQIKGKNDKFTLTVPDGWQHRTYESIEEAQNAKKIMASGVFGKEVKPTDNINLHWYPGQENMMAGVASFHRIELKEAADMPGFLATLNASGKLPQGMEIKPTQLGKNAGLLGGGLAEGIFYVALAYIAQDKVCYVATILGPQQLVAAQWNAFIKMVCGLEATDLKPAKIEDVFKLEPAAEDE